MLTNTWQQAAAGRLQQAASDRGSSREPSDVQIEGVMLSDVLREIRIIQQDLRRIQVQQLYRGGGAAVQSSIDQEDLQRLLEDALTKQHMLLDSRKTGCYQSDLLKHLETTVSERLRDQSIAMGDLMRHVVADEMQGALRKHLDVAVESAVESALNRHFQNAHQSALGETEARLMDAIQSGRKTNRLHTRTLTKRTRLPKVSTSDYHIEEQANGETPQHEISKKNASASSVTVGAVAEEIPTEANSKCSVEKRATNSWFMPPTPTDATKAITIQRLAASWDKQRKDEIVKHFHIMWLNQIVHHFYFRVFVVLYTLVNLVQVGRLQTLDMNEALRNHNVRMDWSFRGWPSTVFLEAGDESSSWDTSNSHYKRTHTSELVLICFYSCMLVLSFLASPYWFIHGHKRKYYIFDTVVCSVACLDMIICALLGHPNSHVLPNLTFCLVFHSVHDLVDVTQKYQVVKFLRTMLNGALHSLSVVWVVLVIILFFGYCSGNILIHGFLVYLNGSPAGSVPADSLASIAEGYGSSANIMIFLTMAMCGGIEMKEIMVPLSKLPAVYTIWVCLFLAFAIFGLLNVTTAVFVDFALQITESNKKDQVRTRLSKQAEWEQQVVDMFKEADEDGSNTLSWQEFENYMGHPVIIAYFHSLELDISEAQGLFTLLDVNGTGHISIEEFVRGCTQLKGEAKSLDLATLRYEFLHFSVNVKQDIRDVKRSLALQTSAITDLVGDDSDSQGDAESVLL